MLAMSTDAYWVGHYCVEPCTVPSKWAPLCRTSFIIMVNIRAVVWIYSRSPNVRRHFNIYINRRELVICIPNNGLGSNPCDSFVWNDHQLWESNHRRRTHCMTPRSLSPYCMKWSSIMREQSPSSHALYDPTLIVTLLYEMVINYERAVTVVARTVWPHAHCHPIVWNGHQLWESSHRRRTHCMIPRSLSPYCMKWSSIMREQSPSSHALYDTTLIVTLL